MGKPREILFFFGMHETDYICETLKIEDVDLCIVATCNNNVYYGCYMDVLHGSLVLKSHR